MTSTPNNQLAFRTWLVKQLVQMRWSVPKGHSIEQAAQVLGVQIDVLHDVQQARDAEALIRGRPRSSRRKRALFRTDHAKLRITMPPVVAQALKEYLGVLRIGASTWIRSLIHHFLSTGAPRPTTTSARWHYQGVVHCIPFEKGMVPPLYTTTRITRGVQIALDYHADTWGVTSTGIVRGLMTDALEGRVQGKFRIVSYSELWGDPERYLHPEKFLP